MIKNFLNTTIKHARGEEVIGANLDLEKTKNTTNEDEGPSS
jgi:hypothetical protein